MGILDRVFSSNEKIAKNVALADSRIIRVWRKYLKTVPDKIRIVNSVIINTARLRELLDTELVDLKYNRSVEIGIITDLDFLLHQHRVEVFHRMCAVLDQAEKQYEFTYRLLEVIHYTIKKEFSIVAALEKSMDNRSRLIQLLRQQIELELITIKKINDRFRDTTFNKLLLSVARGEGIIESLDEIAKRHFAKMQNIFSNEVEESITYRWIQDVVSTLEQRIDSDIDNGILQNHPDTHREFVNSQKFVEIVRDSIKKLKTRGKISERMIQIFVLEFRRGFNQLR